MTHKEVMTLVSSRLTLAQNSKGNIESEGAERDGCKNRQFLANKSRYLRKGTRQDLVTMKD